MREELEQKLQNDFVFMKQSVESSAYGKYECEVLDGWFDLLYAMCSEIKAVGGDFSPRQIKQKYGSLRVYYRTNDDRVTTIVERYEELSETVCEECGKPGVYRKEHIIIQCDTCYGGKSMKIEFLGYCADDTLADAYTERAYPMVLEDFITDTNQSTICAGRCSCCKREVRAVYAIHNFIDAIKFESLSLCLECVRRLPIEVELINIYAHIAPPALRVKETL